jgi:hypothetical protein
VTRRYSRRKWLGASAFGSWSALAQKGHTIAGIRGDAFVIDGRPTYAGRTWEGRKIEGLLMNSRMIQGIFDDENPQTVAKWKYPDTGRWDAERNTREFVAAMVDWKRHGLLSFVVGLQGGSPEGYSKEQPWRNSAFTPDGSLKPPYMARLERILDRADQLGMVPMVNYFYFGQDQHFAGDAAVRRAAREATEWILERGYRNVIVDLVNECDNRSYEQPLLQAPRVHELIQEVKAIQRDGRRLLVSTSFNGGRVPTGNVVKVSDFVLLHGNGVKVPARIAEMVRQVRDLPEYRPIPVLFNEDDHFDFDQPENNMLAAVGEYAGWGYFDPGRPDYADGYQCPPVNWRFDSHPRKRAFFTLLKEVTGA